MIPPFPLKLVICLALALAVVWAPLPFGSVPPWAEGVLQAVSFALAGLGLLVASGERWKAARAPASGLLAIPLAAQVGRVALAALLDVARGPFLSVARAKGGSLARVWFLHALPATAGPIVTVIATQLGALLGGAVVLERLFERAGLGTLILESYASRDLPVLEAAVIAAGALFVLAQGLAAGLHAAIDPRVRT